MHCARVDNICLSVSACAYVPSTDADVNIADAQGNTPLHIAARYGHELLVELLLHNGADANRLVSCAGLSMARIFKSSSCLCVLCMHSCSMYFMFCCCCCCCCCCRCCHRCHRCIRYLCSARQHCHWSLICSSVSSCTYQMTRFNLSFPVFPALCSRGPSNMTPLHLTCLNGHSDSCRTLLAVSDNVSSRDSNGRTPLHAAACSG